ncbi:MAG: ABC transporter substrate-binding protein [Alphaproteobacteria bacterium]|nr:ABC transporter substrate-binding protein [Alphaproteobacteria bacterium]
MIASLGGAAAWPLAARAQQAAKPARIGYLIPSALDAPINRDNFGAIRRQFAELGYLENQTIVFEVRGADSRPDRLPALAAELVALKPDVIIALSTPAGRAVHQATQTIPIVVGSMGDPVGDGLVASLSRPGGNVTGTTFLGPELVAKRLSLLKQLIPTLSRVAILWSPSAFSRQTTDDMVSKSDEAARRLGLVLHYVEAHVAEEFEPAIVAAVEARDEALFQFPNPTFYENRNRLADLAGRYRLPAMFNSREFVEAGGLIAYGASVVDMNRRTAIYVDKILKGARPADLPIEQPTKFELAINLATAKALGIEVPPALLAVADEVAD